MEHKLREMEKKLKAYESGEKESEDKPATAESALRTKVKQKQELIALARKHGRGDDDKEISAWLVDVNVWQRELEAEKPVAQQLSEAGQKITRCRKKQDADAAIVAGLEKKLADLEQELKVARNQALNSANATAAARSEYAKRAAVAGVDQSVQKPPVLCEIRNQTETLSEAEIEQVRSACGQLGTLGTKYCASEDVFIVNAGAEDEANDDHDWRHRNRNSIDWAALWLLA